ncbi:MAG: hypothetical protein BGO54_12170 [Sphingobacteriales bacterium 46-32]|nr:MAG: hypothetical protein BGO54_12170 [Sphingobacteriales bacterium 46-32]
METFFKILLTSDSLEERPPISYRICEYFDEFISERIQEKKPKLISKKWKTDLAIYFMTEGERGPKGIFLAKKPRTIKSEGLKLYEMVVPLKLITNANDPHRKAIEIIYEGIKIFFTSTYKSVSSEFMDELWKEVDLKYLLSLPYPAPLKEQRYVGDYLHVKPDGTIGTVQV